MEKTHKSGQFKLFSHGASICSQSVVLFKDCSLRDQSFIDLLLKNKLLLRFCDSQEFARIQNSLKNETLKRLKREIKKEKHRQKNLIQLLSEIRQVFEDSRVEFVIIKTIDGYPDVGKDIDILVLSNYKRAIRLMVNNGFKQYPLPFLRRKCKKFFKKVNGVPFSVDIYDKAYTLIGETINDLGFFSKKYSSKNIGSKSFPVPSPEIALLIKLDELYLNGQLSLGDVYTLKTLSESDEFDWSYVLEVVKTSGTSVGLFYLLLLLRQSMKTKEIYSNVVNDLHLNIFTKDLLVQFSDPKFPVNFAPAIILQLWVNKSLKESTKGHVLNSLRCILLSFYLLYKTAHFSFLE